MYSLQLGKCSSEAYVTNILRIAMEHHTRRYRVCNLNGKASAVYINIWEYKRVYSTIELGHHTT